MPPDASVCMHLYEGGTLLKSSVDLGSDLCANLGDGLYDCVHCRIHCRQQENASAGSKLVEIPQETLQEAILAVLKLRCKPR